MCEICYGLYPNCPVCGDDGYEEELEDEELEEDDFIDDEE